MDADTRNTRFECQVVCPHCREVNPILWGVVGPAQGMGYAARCVHCFREFRFSRWVYRSSCPGCGGYFTADMHAVISDRLTYQQPCGQCRRVLQFSRTSPPTLLPSGGTTLVMDVTAARRKGRRFPRSG